MNKDSEHNELDNMNIKDPIIDYEAILVYGEMLRPLIASREISKTDLRSLLAQRGCFIGSSDKDITVPILSRSLLRPDEFESLISMQEDKEKDEKRRTQVVPWDSDLSLSEALGNLILPTEQLLDSESTACEFAYPPDLNIENEDMVVVDIEVIRSNPTKDWTKSKSKHTGKATFSIIDGGKNLRIDIDYTSEEIFGILDEVSKLGVKDLKSNGHIPPKKDVKKIVYSDFANRDRIKFMLSLHTEDITKSISFHQVTHVEIKPDDAISLPSDILWMKDRVQTLLLKGKLLHDTEFLKNPVYHECLIIENIEANYKFNINGVTGRFTIVYGFSPARKASDPAEFEIKIINVSYANSTNIKKEAKRENKKILYDRFNNLVKDNYDKIMNDAKSELDSKEDAQVQPT